MALNHRLMPVIALVFFIGCASHQQAGTNASSTSGATPTDASPRTQAQTQGYELPTPNAWKVASRDGRFEGEIVGAPSSASQFAKLQIGMSQRQVEDLIGKPSDMKTYATGKAWIPFYFGKDAYRYETFYKDEGRLTFEGGGVTGTSEKLIRVTVDTTEDGYQ